MPVSISIYKLEQLQKRLRNIRRKGLFLVALVLFSVGVILAGNWLYKRNWSGFGTDVSKPNITISRNQDGRIADISVEIPTPQKNLWDWLSLIIVPGALLLVGYRFQQQQQQRASNEIKEDALQIYFDNLSSALIDKNLLSIAAKISHAGDAENHSNNEHQELLDAAKNIIRARTLSILRKFKDDPKLKANVLLFLIESGTISELKLDLSGADFSGVELWRIDLRGATLRDTNFAEAKICNCDLTGADLSGANFRSTEISFVNFSRARIGGIDFSKAKMSFVDLQEADFFRDEVLVGGLRMGVGINLIDTKLEHLDLSSLNLSGVDFSGAVLKEVNLENASLFAAYFNNANLEKINLGRANLNNAEFFRCNLREANLSYACIDAASFTFANLSNANLSGVDLSKTTLTRKQLRQVRGDKISLSSQTTELQGEQDSHD